MTLLPRFLLSRPTDLPPRAAPATSVRDGAARRGAAYLTVATLLIIVLSFDHARADADTPSSRSIDTTDTSPKRDDVEKSERRDDIESPVDFALPDVDGITRSLSEFRGSWVLVNFWATWCSPCITEIPVIKDFVRRHSDQIVAIGINFETIDADLLRQAIDDFSIDYLVVQAGDEPVTPFEPLMGLPSTFLVTPDGHVAFRHTGELDNEALERAFEATRRRHLNTGG